MVEVHVVRLAGHQLARADEQPHQQLVEPRSRVEVVAVARLLSRVADVLRGKLADTAKNCVRARDAGVGTIHKVVLQVRVQVLHGTATAEENADDGTYDLAVLVADGGAAETQEGVYLAAQMCVEFVHHEIYSTKRGDLVRFLLYLCRHVGKLAF